MLFTLHQHLLQHQKAAHQAFASLDQACCSLAASLAVPSEHDVGGGATLKAPLQAAPPASAVPSIAHRFAQLLRRVEVLHQFLFTNLYVHQRESILRLVADVERCVAGDASAASSLAIACSTMSTEMCNSSCADEGQRELRRQITQLRYQLARPAQAPASGCISTHIDGAISDLLARAPTAVPPSSACSSLPHESVHPGPLSATPWTVSHATSSPPAQAGVAASQMRVASRQNTHRLRLFALSSAFQEYGVTGQHELAAVLHAVQRRFHVHAVLLGRTASRETEVDVAVRLGCLCLVVPHRSLGSFPGHPGLVVTSDRAVLAHMESRANGESFTHAAMPPAAGELPVGCDVHVDEDLAGMTDGGGESSSALEELFQTLEVDFPLSATAESVWPPPLSTAAVRCDAQGSEALIVERSALRRDGRHAPGQWKRHRSGGAVDSPAHSASTSGRECVVVPPRECDAHSHTEANFPNSSSRAGTLGATRLQAGAVACAMGPVQVYDAAAADADVIIPSQLTVESQHVGISQNLSSSRFSATPSGSAPVTPALCPHNDVSRADDAASPASVAEASAPQPLVFQISNSVKYLKAQLVEAIGQLGGVVDQSSGYSRRCRYLVVAEGITERTEKYLGACAAAAYIVPPRFVFDSQRRGYWLANRVQEYDMSPQRAIAHAPHAVPIFSNWRVVLITCRTAAARGVLAALLAGGCSKAIAFVVDLTAEPPLDPGAHARVYDETCATAEGVVEGVPPSSMIAEQTLRSATHILVECSSVTAQGFFQMPDWIPACVRQPECQPRIFTLELLYFCLCAHPERVFDAEGRLSEVEALTPACRVEPCG
ncbi:hypothetical protein LSCM1_06172 [Leishmania martiniquensis]|uniref:BRCT domain-containing protein n=1 Tax=Leishmania martiniquensis TaxID=1580590 RepID=A0A836HLD2_9TRYP|nr:hypothetical protein LSCM1_06172 [Leishmania martiniquensis]